MWYQRWTGLFRLCKKKAIDEINVFSLQTLVIQSFTCSNKLWAYYFHTLVPCMDGLPHVSFLVAERKRYRGGYLQDFLVMWWAKKTGTTAWSCIHTTHCNHCTGKSLADGTAPIIHMISIAIKTIYMDLHESGHNSWRLTTEEVLGISHPLSPTNWFYIDSLVCFAYT